MEVGTSVIELSQIASLFLIVTAYHFFAPDRMIMDILFCPVCIDLSIYLMSTLTYVIIMFEP